METRALGRGDEDQVLAASHLFDGLRAPPRPGASSATTVITFSSSTRMAALPAS
ncbi:MAG TPA: hypothetical protein VMU75_09005 [Acidimicrobiales bacterium]|nr:hypothetical protein [Acidimicrobiales bacterium]